MRKIKIAAAVAASILIFAGTSCASASSATSAASSAAQASSQSSQNVLGNTVTNLLQGVLKTSNLKVADFCGEWTADGSAVSFKTDNFLKQAGGLAAAGAIEAKINPYFEKLGLNRAVLTVKDDNTFTIAVSGIKVSGTITPKDEKKGIFVFSFKVLGMQFGNLDTYIQKSGNHLDVMFDADKLMTLISAIAKFSGNNLANTAASIVDSYDGLCLGFSMNKTGNVESTSPDSTNSSSSTSGAGGLGGLLQNVMGGGRQSSSSGDSSTSTQTNTTTTDSNSNSSSNSNSNTNTNTNTNTNYGSEKSGNTDPGSILFDLLKKK